MSQEFLHWNRSRSDVGKIWVFSETDELIGNFKMVSCHAHHARLHTQLQRTGS